MVRRVLRWMLVGTAVLFLAIQVVPYGRRHTNPLVRVEPRWDSPATRVLAVRACSSTVTATRPSGPGTRTWRPSRG
jgi:hypothetical protein